MKFLVATQYSTNATQIFLAFLYASMLASFITALLFYPAFVGWNISWNLIKEFIEVFLVAMFFWTLCIVLLGGPIWWLFHKLNWLHYIHFAHLGGVVPVVAMFVLFYFGLFSPQNFNGTPLDAFLGSLYLALVFGAVGLPLGLLIRKVAYY